MGIAVSYEAACMGDDFGSRGDCYPELVGSEDCAGLVGDVCQNGSADDPAEAQADGDWSDVFFVKTISCWNIGVPGKGREAYSSDWKGQIRTPKSKNVKTRSPTLCVACPCGRGYIGH